MLWHIRVATRVVAWTTVMGRCHTHNGQYHEPASTNDITNLFMSASSLPCYLPVSSLTS